MGDNEHTKLGGTRKCSVPWFDDEEGLEIEHDDDENGNVQVIQLLGCNIF